MSKVKSLLLDFLYILAGSCIYGFSVNAFTAPNNIAPGGITGISTMLHYLMGTPIGIVSIIINIPIIIWAIVEIGYKLVLKTTVAIIMSSIAIDIFSIFVPAYHGDFILISMCAGVCEGVGLSLVFMRGATTGGTDMIARLLNNKIKFLSVGKLMLVVDGLIIAASALVFKSFESALYACIVVFVSTTIIDKILYGTDVGTGKLFFVVSKKNKDIAARIMEEMDRGVTYLKSIGGYSEEEGEVLLCAVRRFEIFKIHEIIRSIDKSAFVIVGDAGEITGEGFKSIKSDDKTLGEIIEKIKSNSDKKESTDAKST